MADPAAKKALRPGKPVFKLDLPYTQPQWPQLATADHDIMLEMLVNLLAPIGQHRSAHVTPSKGKRSKKRKRHGAPSEAAASAPPPPPDLTRHITVGINSTTRHLEQLAQAAEDAPAQGNAIPAPFIYHDCTSAASHADGLTRPLFFRNCTSRPTQTGLGA
ncbi:hypothetical protein BFW01_g8463 [Lasiodiplodia theobromae]|uniref:Rna-processing protein n=1 Tax=Lasiodiplodia theobromae TaxID=45133 RepID=UPI0015C2C7EE|nr:Rna-processing protein [Lasiodiplodia theobromae]KAF4538744.1 Rna-processing protein [Lasiodiplodia theobromae]KAF9637567.1 hypothetical protein BFW01_g8463 [Lasiodiplodia theobromae]